jgi:hypothetical protein
MTKPATWQAVAFNQATDSTNQIHSDEMAQAYGFKGGLVPGVTISSYLTHPAAAAWGRQWLEAGAAHIEVHKPLYDGYSFDVELNDVSDTAYRAVLVDQEGTRCATGHIWLNHDLPQPPVRRGDPLLERDADIPPVSSKVLGDMAGHGMRALAVRWDAEHRMARYVEDASAMASVHRSDGDGLANTAFLLGLTNWVLAGNTYMNPWVHMQTDSQYFAAVETDTDLIVECAVENLFEKRGHEFVDARVDAYVRDIGQAVMSTTLRAIYKLRPPSSASSG